MGHCAKLEDPLLEAATKHTFQSFAVPFVDNLQGILHLQEPAGKRQRLQEPWEGVNPGQSDIGFFGAEDVVIRAAPAKGSMSIWIWAWVKIKPPMDRRF